MVDEKECTAIVGNRLVYRKRWYLANVKLDMFISILYVNIANLKSVPIEIFAEILNVFMIVRNIRQNSDVFYIVEFLPPWKFQSKLFSSDLPYSLSQQYHELR